MDKQEIFGIVMGTFKLTITLTWFALFIIAFKETGTLDEYSMLKAVALVIMLNLLISYPIGAMFKDLLELID